MLTKLYTLLTPPERKHAVALTGLIMLVAFFDVVGMGSILPFVAVLADPELVRTNPVLNVAFTASRQVGIDTENKFLFLLGVLFFALLIASLALKALSVYAQIRFALMREQSVARRLVEGYLRQPYSWFLNRHSMDLGKTVLSEVGTVISGGLTSLMTLVSQVTVTLALLILLVIVDPLLAVSVIVVLGAVYAAMFAAMGGWLQRLGEARIAANRERFRVVSEAFGASKALKVGGLEEVYIQRFASAAERYAKGQAVAQTISQLPRYALEAIAFGGMLLVVLYLMVKSESFATALPIIALYVFAGYRLLPAIQQIYSAIVQLRVVSPALDDLCKDIGSLGSVESPQGHVTPLTLTKGIKLELVSYRYPYSERWALKGIDLNIPARTTVGFVGVTGSGKTTTVDVILALLEPQEGLLSIDDHPITASNRRQWQRAIGYVPQNIYLTDDSVAANIAFGVDVKDIDQKAVERAARIANLHEFVINDLPQGYATNVGERGVRLSGGQCQRIGIARALYHNPQVLILDEATSALDNLTEQAVMQAVSNLGHDMTVILIAHRFSTVRECDQIYVLERGEVKASGTYEELIVTSEQFAAIANV